MNQPITQNHFQVRAFTLLEMLIAMAIFSMIGLASHQVLTTVLDSDALSSARTAKLQSLQRAMLFMERDLLQATARSVRINGEASEQVLQGGANLLESEADGLILVRSGWHNPQLMLPRSTLQPVAYRLYDGELQRLYGNYPDNIIGFEPRIKTLLTDVEDFQVQFVVAPASQARQLEWKDSYQGTVLPQAIAITIRSKDFGLIRREFLLTGEGKADATE
ncbi:type II secretion system minor pseudopilin GspJ [Lacimicrobium sp. SS2-24]|uniref:type II secretion system minor pseudopilin GspJ n=1 Tax=Lacimicrobium sp. SS2-24 TaxID=2005569 RepID=UPI000B4C02B0|nr:type II secretion system minor pseudopilin GspJ [Lacimicrobium sp. SS2-24]